MYQKTIATQIPLSQIISCIMYHVLQETYLQIKLLMWVVKDTSPWSWNLDDISEILEHSPDCRVYHDWKNRPWERTRMQSWTLCQHCKILFLLIWKSCKEKSDCKKKELWLKILEEHLKPSDSVAMQKWLFHFLSVTEIDLDTRGADA